MLARVAVLLNCFLALAAVSEAGSIETIRRVFPGPEIPRTISTQGSVLITDSDSLYLNTRLLDRTTDYRYVASAGAFELSLNDTAFAGSDTLVVSYRKLPAWAGQWFGRTIPEAGVSDSRVAPVIVDDSPSRELGGGRGVSINGAKSFRFAARSAGTSEFSQSLNMTIGGELAPGVEISGAITDRGFDPTYGTLNSRLSDLDKVNIQLRSKRVHAQLGDITLSGMTTGLAQKQVSGASTVVTFPSWHVEAAAARPRGRFESARFYGSDGFQGPYQVTGNTGQAIVPGSESVWLDGEPMERGVNKDYTMDYPTGRITFSVSRPIDLRSRIEIDYEPLTTAYKQELFAFGGGAHTTDSVLFFSVGALREGDDSEAPETGEFSSGELALLEAAGDSAVFRSGVIPDTSGNYSLVIDSLPDSVYQYVGEGAGDLAVTFTYVGAGEGSYEFIGSGVYRFVGGGSGDYEPVVELTPPERTNEYRVLAGSQLANVGTLTADLRTSDLDRNLYSSIDDADNAAHLLDLSFTRQWQAFRTPNKISAHRRVREPDFVARERIDDPDFERTWYRPPEFERNTTELLHEGSALVTPVSGVTLGANGGELRYRERFVSRRVGATIDMSPTRRLRTGVSYVHLSSKLDDTALDGKGSVDNANATASLALVGDITLGGSYEFDRRRNRYYDDARGTSFNRVRVETRRFDDFLRWEYYAEDSLTSDWNGVLDRNRLTAGSSRRFGDLTYDATATYQWLSGQTADETNFLGRVNLRYDSPRSGLTVSSSYLVSEEVRNARGISYLEVDQGLGDYIFEDGQYIPDPDGNFIRVEELLSSVDRVRRGEKSFYLSRAFDFGSVRLTSDIKEELLPEGERSALWALPFYSDPDQAYLFFERRYAADVRLFPLVGFHVIVLDYSEQLERRRIVDEGRERRDRQGSVSFRQRVRQTFLEQSVSVFSYERDEYYSGAGDVTGYDLAVAVTQRIVLGEVSIGGAYRKADDGDRARSKIYSAIAGSRLRVVERGELRTSLELYRQTLRGDVAGSSYQLTDNRPGDRGAVWSVILNYGVREGLRVSLNLSGRHADNRTARVYGRGEVVAGF
ncbi:hypothetical protein KQH82_01405 [bacterium]|nr:hypothetical protein [bacterium]